MFYRLTLVEALVSSASLSHQYIQMNSPIVGSLAHIVVVALVLMVRVLITIVIVTAALESVVLNNTFHIRTHPFTARAFDVGAGGQMTIALRSLFLNNQQY